MKGFVSGEITFTHVHMIFFYISFHFIYRLTKDKMDGWMDR